MWSVKMGPLFTHFTNHWVQNLSQTDGQTISLTPFTGVCRFFLSVKIAPSLLASLARNLRSTGEGGNIKILNTSRSALLYTFSKCQKMFGKTYRMWFIVVSCSLANLFLSFDLPYLYSEHVHGIGRLLLALLWK